MPFLPICVGDMAGLATHFGQDNHSPFGCFSCWTLRKDYQSGVTNLPYKTQESMDLFRELSTCVNVNDTAEQPDEVDDSLGDEFADLDDDHD